MVHDLHEQRGLPRRTRCRSRRAASLAEILNRIVNFASPLAKRILAQEVEVNTAQVKGNWQQLVGKAKKKWGRLTEEPLSFTDLGEQQVKNITQPIRV
jgi:hypothetical protein